MSEKQLPHLVFGGKVTNPQTLDFDYDNIDIVGIYSCYADAESAWRQVSQYNVDDALTKYVVVHLHRMMEPDK